MKGDILPCGHPVGCVTQEPDGVTQYCRWCADVAELARLHDIEQKALDQSQDVQEHWLSPCEAAGLRAELARLREIEAAYRITSSFRERADRLTDNRGYSGKHWVEALLLRCEYLSVSTRISKAKSASR